MFYSSVFLLVFLWVTTQLNATEKNRHNVDVNTLLHVAIEKGNIDIIKFLVENNAHINATDHINTTPLHLAVFFDNVNAIRCLIDNKANIEPKDLSGMTPLHYAAANGKINAMRTLLVQKVDVKVKSVVQMTSLDYACSNFYSYKNLNVIKCLVEHKSDVDIIFRGYKGDIDVKMVEDTNIRSLLVGASLLEPIKTMLLVFNRQKKDQPLFCPPKPIREKIISYYWVNSSITTFIQNLHKKNLLDGVKFTLVRKLFCLSQNSQKTDKTDK